MPRWTNEDLERYNAHRQASNAKPKPPVRHEPMAATCGEVKDPARVLVRITAFRVRRLDPDNACPKYFVDCLRYADIIKNDRDQDIILEIRQERALCKADERTEITIVPCNT